MSRRPPVALILAAGRGERMNSSLPKVLHEACGVTLLGHVLETVREAGIKRVSVVVGAGAGQVRSFLRESSGGIARSGNPLRFRRLETVSQTNRLGTAHAVLQAEPRLRHWQGDVLILPGDAPCLRAETVRQFISDHRKSGRVASVLTAEVAAPDGYGRILRRGDEVVGIREERDATEAERKISEVSSGVYLFRAPQLFRQLRKIKKNATKQEYYLTDVMEMFARSGQCVRAHRIDDGREILGVNTRRELALADQILRGQELERHAQNGVTILDPAQTYIAKGVVIGGGTIIHPFTWVERDVRIGQDCEIGPFAKIRSASRIHDRAAIGSFVEVARSEIGEKTCVKHLSYVGDARIGKGVNIGAGTITANFDGRKKNRTVVEDRALVGCDTVLVAPVRVGRGAKTGAGSVVLARQTVPRGETVVGIPAHVVGKKHKGRKR